MRYINVTDENNLMYKIGLNLYETAFPFCERRLETDIKNAMYHPDFYYVCAYSDSGDFVGIIMYWKTSYFVYIEHFAINEEFRGRGFGTKILKDFIANFGAVPIILEIEPPIDDATNARKRFYKNLGFTQIDVKHMQIIFHKDCPEMELKIMSKPEIDAKFYDKFRNYLDGTIARYTQK